MKTTDHHITGIILAGGKSSRMGSEKGLVEFKGSPFIKHVIEALKPVCERLIIVSDNTAYDSFEVERIEDQYKNTGPLAGLYSGLKAADSDLNLVLSCDIPQVTSNLLRYLIDQIDNGHDIFQFKAFNKVIPLIGIYRKRCGQTSRDLIEDGERRLLALQDHHPTLTIDLPK
ncbi:MAG: molybdenum cofactor guanylyltransferase, partial [Bacteroidia bacterium]|nr:molybdenum cofactor guanylyltransferase [Bacteroidia bacterium]